MKHNIGIIPARYASSRFPGKPLADIAGKPMIQRVYEQAKKVLNTVIVATDDERIYECVSAFGGEAVMTSPNHTCGTDRVYEAFQHYYAQQLRNNPEQPISLHDKPLDHQGSPGPRVSTDVLSPSIPPALSTLFLCIWLHFLTYSFTQWKRALALLIL